MKKSLRLILGLGRRLGRLALVTSALELALGSACPAWSQRRREEPEANPGFQQQLQSPPSDSTGSPVATSQDSSSSSDEPSPMPRATADVQIGATPAPRPAVREAAAPLDTRVTVRVKGAPLPTFLDTISAQAKINFIVTDDVVGTHVTAFLQNVTVREALQVLLEIKGLTYQQVGKSNTYLVEKRSKEVDNLVTRVYTLSYVPLIPLSAPSSGGSSGSSGMPGGSSMGGSSGGAGGIGGSPAAADQAGAIAIIKVIESVLTPKGKVAIEPRTNSLIVTDLPEVFPQVEQIISELDKKAPQVMIEAQIVEIDSTKTKDLGLEWGGPNGELAAFEGGERDTSFPMILPSSLSALRFLDPLASGSVISSIGSSAATSNATSGVSSGSNIQISGQSYLKTSVLDLTQLTVILRALVESSEARFLGKPKILTLNNQKATIQISRQEADYLTTGVSGIGSVGLTTVSPHTDETGLILNVTPQVNKDGYITMLVNPSFTDVIASAISTASNPVFDPISRSATALVRVKNGQTLVLGGLLESTESKDVRKVPLLGYIPIIGWLFTSVSNVRTNTDLVIFLTPTIVND